MPQVLRYGAFGLPSASGGRSLDMLMLLEWPTRGSGQSAGYIWEGGKRFYGTRVCPGWYQSSAGVARGCKAPFSVLRMLMQANGKPPFRDLQARYKPSEFAELGRHRTRGIAFIACRTRGDARRPGRSVTTAMRFSMTVSPCIPLRACCRSAGRYNSERE
jgi:hypothetical protein